MSDHSDLADQREAELERLARESERNAEHADEARAKLQAARDQSYAPAALGDEDPGHRAPSEAEQRAVRKEEEAEEAAPDTIGESVDARLSDMELGEGGERTRGSTPDDDED